MTDAELQTASPLTQADIDRRISFIDDLQIIVIDFSDLHLDNSVEVNSFYDRVEERIDETGEDLWFFLTDYTGSWVHPDAWFTFSRRGKMLHRGHAMGSVRVESDDATRRQIKLSKGTINYDANLFADRDEAIERLSGMKSKRRKKIVLDPNYSRADFEPRLQFLEAEDIMEIDLSGLRLHHSADVNVLYDFLEDSISSSGRKWYFLINYNDCHIDPAAWVQWAKRGKNLNIGGSLGTVRYEAGAETEADIRMRAETQGFRPNIRNTREEALERLAEMKAEAAQ